MRQASTVLTVFCQVPDGATLLHLALDGLAPSGAGHQKDFSVWHQTDVQTQDSRTAPMGPNTGQQSGNLDTGQWSGTLETGQWSGTLDTGQWSRSPDTGQWSGTYRWRMLVWCHRCQTMVRCLGYRKSGPHRCQVCQMPIKSYLWRAYNKSSRH